MNKINVGNDLYLKGRIGWRGLSKEEYLEYSDYRIINATSLEDNFIDWNSCGYISKVRYEESPEIQLKENDILISKDGTLGKIGYVKHLEKPSTVASGIFVLRNTCKEILNNNYLYHFLKSKIFKDFIFRNKALGSTINHLYQRDLEELEIELPNLITQNKVANILSSLDSKIEINKKIIEQLEYLTKTIYNYWFLQFEFPDKNGKPYKSSGGKMVWNKELKRDIPVNWVVDKIDNIIPVKDGTHDSPKAQEIGFPLITSKHLLECGIDFENANLISEDDYIAVNKRSKVETGDILFSMIGTVGTVYKVEEKDINFAIKNVALYKTSQKEEYKNYIYMYLKSWYMKVYMSNVLSGSIQKFIGLGHLRNMPLIISDTYIRKFEQTTKNLFEQINNLKIQNQELTKLRDWLLPMLFNGQVIFKTEDDTKEKYFDVERVAETSSEYGEG
ncbi:restriction endonuclease subunit S [Clostridium sp. C8-1-8]|uniref:restriction endonuclease subunit S n=1 Tax=Clostridium sp. C8-1-8 TaxID=2698831 RepID=UPI00136E8A42|nr:restriction endonuclease subunit S [Clostridium sp. C8-1-8]